MTPDERDRLTRLEVGGDERGADIKEIKDLLTRMDSRMSSLERVAASGNGALRTALVIGGIVGWVIGLIVAVIAIFKH